jgi:hypothetical protein
MQNTQIRREKACHSKSLPEQGDRELMEQRLMTVQIRVWDLDREAIAAHAVPETLSQPVRESPKILQSSVEVFEQS